AKSTQYAADFSTLYQYQDGYATGFLEEITIGTDGVVYGHYTNGQTRELYQIVLANFVNPSGLIKRGGNLYEQSPYSGEPLVGLPGSAGLGSIVPNSLEQSNVDLAEEFTKIIIYQRAFQANARVVTTTDDMLGEVVNLRR
ncbi:MAG: flagellar hook-basal body complex protein, partial [Nitrososphaerota archaeon]